MLPVRAALRSPPVAIGVVRSRSHDAISRSTAPSDLRNTRPEVTLRFRDGLRVPKRVLTEFRPECDAGETREFRRELARLITFFDLCSPSIFLRLKIAEFSRKSAPGRS